MPPKKAGARYLHPAAAAICPAAANKQMTGPARACGRKGEADTMGMLRKIAVIGLAAAVMMLLLAGLTATLTLTFIASA